MSLVSPAWFLGIADSDTPVPDNLQLSTALVVVVGYGDIIIKDDGVRVFAPRISQTPVDAHVTATYPPAFLRQYQGFVYHDDIENLSIGEVKWSRSDLSVEWRTSSVSFPFPHYAEWNVTEEGNKFFIGVNVRQNGNFDGRTRLAVTVEISLDGVNPLQSQSFPASYAPIASNPTAYVEPEFTIPFDNPDFSSADGVYFRAIDSSGMRSTWVKFTFPVSEQNSAFWHPNNAVYAAQNSTSGVAITRRAQPSAIPETLATIAGTKNPTIWQRTANNRPSGTFEMLARKDGAKWQLYRSTNGGTTWTPMGTSPFEASNIDYMTGVPVGSGYVVLAIVKGSPNKLVSKRTADVEDWPPDSEAKTVRPNVANKPITLTMASDGRRDLLALTAEGVLVSKDGETWP